MKKNNFQKTYWIIPCNPNTYKVDDAFKELKQLYWKQSKNVKCGDVVYIYVSNGIRKICYKCVVVNSDCSRSVADQIDDSDFSLDATEYGVCNRYMLLQLLTDTVEANLSLSNLRKNGLKGNIQGPQKIKDQLLLYINNEVNKKCTMPIENHQLLKDDCLDDKISDAKVDFLLKNTSMPNIVYQPETPPLMVKSTNGGYSFPRNAKRKANAIVLADYCCEYNKEHTTFIRKSNSKPYTEAHHLIPLTAQCLEKFAHVNLDCEANIVSLCSNCHNEIHYGINAEKIIRELYIKRKEKLHKCGIEIDIEDLLKFYQ